MEEAYEGSEYTQAKAAGQLRVSQEEGQGKLAGL